jgi:hypothetical protein
MADSTKYFNTSISEDILFCPVTGTLELLKSSIQNRLGAYTRRVLQIGCAIKEKREVFSNHVQWKLQHQV